MMVRRGTPRAGEISTWVKPVDTAKLESETKALGLIQYPANRRAAPLRMTDTSLTAIPLVCNLISMSPFGHQFLPRRFDFCAGNLQPGMPPFSSNIRQQLEHWNKGWRAKR
jgi:hypothetical protein